MKTPVWVLRETILALHEQLLSAFGGSTGIRDSGLLDSALARPQSLLAYGKPSLFDLAASYGFGLVKDHPFVDGNKRIGFTVAILFLELNGYQFDATQADATIQTLRLAAGEMTEAGYAAWLQANSKRPRKARNA
jgi:death-on-curing protein